MFLFNSRLAGSIVESKVIAAVVRVFFFSKLAGSTVESRVIAPVAGRFFCNSKLAGNICRVEGNCN